MTLQSVWSRHNLEERSSVMERYLLAMWASVAWAWSLLRYGAPLKPEALILIMVLEMAALACPLSPAHAADNPQRETVAPRFAMVMTVPAAPDGRLCVPQRLVKVPIVDGRVQVNEISRYPDRTLLVQENLIIVHVGKAAGFCDRDGRIKIPLNFDYVASFSCGLAVVARDKKYGYVDPNGRFIVELRFDYAFSFVGDLGCVKEGDKWGLLSTKGQWVVKPTYKRLEPLNGGILCVTFDGREAWIAAGTKNEGNEKPTATKSK